MISGGLLAPMYRNITYPTELNEEIQRIASGYESLPFTDLYIKGKEEENMEKLFQNIEKQTRVVKHLMSHHEWDFLAYVFYQPDAAAHYYWHHYDKNSSWDDFRADPKWENAMKEIYKKVDDGLGQILESAPSDSNVIIVSDHGSGPLKGLFNVNEWLSQQKLLSYLESSDKENGDLWLEKLKKHMVGSFPGLSKSLVRVLPKAILQRFLYSGQTKSSYAKLISRIKWNETTAYGLGSMGSIYVNLRGREPFGTVNKEEYETVREKIIDGLNSLRNPLSGEPVRISIWKREEIYSGPMLEQAPDILFMMEDYQFYQRVDVDGGSIWRSPDMSGGHSRDGLFIAYGPDIRKGGDLNMRFGICDVMPTALHMSGVDIPSDVDGRVLMEIFRNDSPYFQNKPKLADQKAANVSVEPVYTSEEEEEINQRLKDLGYV